jgi:cellobiose-specific phosphotransferase system component IIB
MIRKVVCAAGATSAELVKSIEKAEKPLDQYDIIVFDSREKGLEIEARHNGAKRCYGIPWVKQSIIMGALQSFL